MCWRTRSRTIMSSAWKLHVRQVGGPEYAPRTVFRTSSGLRFSRVSATSVVPISVHPSQFSKLRRNAEWFDQGQNAFHCLRISSGQLQVGQIEKVVAGRASQVQPLLGSKRWIVIDDDKSRGVQSNPGISRGREGRIALDGHDFKSCFKEHALELAGERWAPIRQDDGGVMPMSPVPLQRGDRNLRSENFFLGQ